LGKNLRQEGGISQATYDENPSNLKFKDPLVKQSDDWNFPTNKFPTVGWVGRVHRGTAVAECLLKGAQHSIRNKSVNPALGNVGTNTWAIWMGDTANTFDAVNSAPIQDRLLFRCFLNRAQ